MSNPIRVLVAGVLVMTLAACQTTNKYQNSSAVDFLYPHGHDVSEVGVPHLKLPLRVGIAFTPGWQDGPVDPATRHELLKLVSDRFAQVDFVESIEIIPDGYLRRGGSFANLDQLQRMFGIDQIALVSYDQTAFTDETAASLLYLTIVGAYVVPAEKNTTHTLLDAVVYDIDSRKLLFRAPGISTIKRNSTLINLPRRQRYDAVEGMTAASQNLSDNLQSELLEFRKRVRNQPELAEVSVRQGQWGGGSIGLGLLAAAGLLVAGARRR